MISYVPIECTIPWTHADDADLVSFNWLSKSAEFVSNVDGATLVVTFDGEVIVRMLDELPLSTESDPKAWTGIILHHFAYRVEGDPFLFAQSDTWRSMEPKLAHYRFLTGSGCLDVATSATPQFKVFASGGREVENL